MCNTKAYKTSVFERVGEFNAFNDTNVSVGISYTYLGSDRTMPIITINGKDFLNVVSCCRDKPNQKIVDLSIDYSTSPWKLVIEAYIDGAFYTKYINLT